MSARSQKRTYRINELHAEPLEPRKMMDASGQFLSAANHDVHSAIVAQPTVAIWAVEDAQRIELTFGASFEMSAMPQLGDHD